MDNKHFKVKIEDKIAQVFFNKPEKANALNMDAWIEMQTVFETLSVFFFTLACDFLHFGYFIFDFLRRIRIGTHTIFFAAIDGTDRAIAWRYSSICES